MDVLGQFMAGQSCCTDRGDTDKIRSICQRASGDRLAVDILDQITASLSHILNLDILDRCMAGHCCHSDRLKQTSFMLNYG